MQKKKQLLEVCYQTKEEVLKELSNNPNSMCLYNGLPEKLKTEFINVCTGKQSIPLCYDAVFKKIFSPDMYPRRLGKLLSAIMGESVEVISVLTNEGTRISDKGSFVIMDIVVRLASGEIVNLEIQKMGYRFPVKRFDCYCADLIMREYSSLREEYGRKFSYNMLPKIISIAIFENTPDEIRREDNVYIQHSQMRTDAGTALNSVPEHYYISLDKYKDTIQNNNITSMQEAWLMLLSSTDLNRIEELIEFDSEFKHIYDEMFQMMVDPKELIQMYTNIFLEADRIEEQFVLDEMREEIDEKNRMIDSLEEKNKEAEAAKEEAEAAKKALETEVQAMREYIKELESKK